MKFSAYFATIIFLLSACATLPQKEFGFDDVTFSTDFEGGNFASVARVDDRYVITIKPENTPINNSPWYAFEISGAKGQAIPITLSYKDGTHRYSPKIQSLGGEWVEFDGVVDIAEDKSSVNFSVTPTSDVIRIAAQPIIDNREHMSWSKELATLSFVSFENIGTSVENRPIYKLEEIDDPQVKKPYVVVIGRQHPPEVTGAQALKPFVETVWGDSDLARQFRSEFNMIVIPAINPDGVAKGFWRHNVGGLDLNRDWGPFTQPETQAAQRELNRFASGKDELVLFLDFHSTWRNLIYTQTDEEDKAPAFFTRDWISNVKARLPDDVYSFTREANVTTDRPVSKNYIYHKYGIPAMTFEVGDKTLIEATETASEIFAEEMMKLLLNPAPL